MAEPTREEIKNCFLNVERKYGDKGDNFMLQIVCEELRYKDKDAVREVLRDLSEKGEI